jgi:hypothetical protein
MTDIGVVKFPCDFQSAFAWPQSQSLVYSECAKYHRACVFWRNNTFWQLCSFNSGTIIQGINRRRENVQLPKAGCVFFDSDYPEGTMVEGVRE